MREKISPEHLLQVVLHHTRGYEQAKREQNMRDLESRGSYLQGLQEGLSLLLEPALVRSVFRGARQIVESETPEGAYLPVVSVNRVA